MARWEELERALAYRFRRRELLEKACTHASAARRPAESNERLEFLGDAVVQLIVTRDLFKALPDATEGDLTRARASVVCRPALAEACRSLGLQKWLRTDGSWKADQPIPDSMAANLYEALVGAIYLDGGLRAASRFVVRTLRPAIERAKVSFSDMDSKSALQCLVQADGKGLPQYKVARTRGPDHARRFLVEVYVNGKKCGSGWGDNKKEAQQRAAAQALKRLYKRR